MSPFRNRSTVAVAIEPPRARGGDLLTSLCSTARVIVGDRVVLARRSNHGKLRCCHLSTLSPILFPHQLRCSCSEDQLVRLPSVQAHTFEALPARVCLFSLLGVEDQYVTIEGCASGADYKNVDEVKRAIEVQKGRPPEGLNARLAAHAALYQD